MTISGLSISESAPEPPEVTEMQTLTTYSTTTVTEHSQATVPPFTILGVTASATILVLLAIIVVRSILIEKRKR